MPLYFAYGANLDRIGMARRCPRSTVVGQARLHGHRFIVMADGFASVVRVTGSTVHGLVWNLALSDVRALDRFEELERGLYKKVMVSVLGPHGARRALVYIGHTIVEGTPAVGYMETVLAAAMACGFPARYLRELGAWLPSGLGASRRVPAVVTSTPRA